MKKQYKAVRGMNDILPNKSHIWQFLENSIRDLMLGYGYKEIKTPIVEYIELFSRGIGTGTDIIEKEMYQFEDKGGSLLSLRPELTAGITRACIEHGMLYNQIQRLWSMGPCFRYERPQKGRFRQFHQLSVEAFGLKDPEIDVELMLITARLWKNLKLTPYLKLEINSIGSTESRHRFRQALVEYLLPYKQELDSDSQNRLNSNPIKIFDTKNIQTQKILNNAPKLSHYLDDESKSYFDMVCLLLNNLNIPYVCNTKLVRGLDYYSGTVFEWSTDSLGAQGTVCGGGRYDGLIQLLGEKPSSSMGFAIGMERLILMLESLPVLPNNFCQAIDIVILTTNKKSRHLSLAVIEKIKDHLPRLRIKLSDGGSFKGQLKRAYQSEAVFACIFNDQFLASGLVELKSLTNTSNSHFLLVDSLIQKLQHRFNKSL